MPKSVVRCRKERELLSKATISFTCDNCKEVKSYIGTSQEVLDKMFDDGWRPVKDGVSCGKCKK